ncbi:hypothetical protein HSRCO_1719 [Halanaeroarchaeum sp. HSR-CO]|uniref:hypothetical protein n=1 Tax=Halanaeroarchaeum sp. HSR-CO TaxID=2866382 RepID=UPI00217CF991|nr:hypothetical protein [Halanaeroarchaeum sp. HSR-CO]UWG47998.1 hypothetical protein HSRCO_1719 [Halanaeroarchaeum sp. HSR-CO]
MKSSDRQERCAGDGTAGHGALTNDHSEMNECGVGNVTVNRDVVSAPVLIRSF